MMTIYMAKGRLTRIDKQYWTYGLLFESSTLVDAAKFATSSSSMFKFMGFEWVPTSVFTDTDKYLDYWNTFTGTTVMADPDMLQGFRNFIREGTEQAIKALL